MEKKTISLEEDAEKLFREIKGLESERQLESFSEVADLLANCLKAEEESLDKWRVHLADVVHFVSSYFVSAQFLEGVRNKKDSFSDLLGAFNRLSKMPEKADGVLVKFRGHPQGSGISRKIDYVASYGSLVIDCAIAKAMFTRMGLRMSHLAARTNRAFEVLSKQGVNTIYIKIPRHTSSRIKELEDSLEIVSRFNTAVNAGNPIVYSKDGERKVVLLIRDENSVPDPNLTLLAALNNLGPEFMKKLVRKVDAWVKASESDADDRNAGIYEAVFSAPSIGSKLIRPPVEINNVKWIMKERGGQKITREQAIVTRHVMSSVKGPPERKSEMLRSVYGTDYSKVDSEGLGRRIMHLSNLIDSLEAELRDLKIGNEIFDNVKSRFEEIREDIFDDIFISENAIQIRSGGQETILEKVNGKMRDMVDFFKTRAGTRKKIKALTCNPLDLTDRDYEIIAKDFGISVEGARRILTLLKGCFDGDGRFRRSEFEKHVPAFAKYDDKVFDLLWHFLKETPFRNDRVAFLNSLQHLIVQMDHPEKALKVLIADFYRNPRSVSFSDRNALMLAILLVRKYNKELRLDIEITPEEVLDVRDGINRQAAEMAANMIDADQEAFIAKIRTVHGRLLEAMAAGGSGTDENSMPLRFLLSLEREAFIFLSLVQGGTARSVLRSAAREYGDPRSEVYRAQKNAENTRTTLQHLKVLVRALGRLEDEDTISIFSEIRSREAEFCSLGSGSAHESLVRKIISQARRTQSGSAMIPL